MENSVETLKMAAAVLMFVIALSVAVNSFLKTRETVDTLVSQTDREISYISGDDRYYYVSDETKVRTVGVETIIPTIYRAYDESYKIIFLDLDETALTLFEKNGVKISKFDPGNENHGTHKAIKAYLNAIIYGDYTEYGNADTFKTQEGITNILDNKLYEYLKYKQFEEYIGTYFKSDLDASTATADVPDANKVKLRVITYKLIS